jgi:uncharacterized protein
MKMLPDLSASYNRFILGAPGPVLACLLLLSLFAGYHLKDFRLDASADSLLLESDSELRIFREVSERFGTQDFLFVTFTPAQELFSDGSLEQVKRLRDELTQLPLVSSVISLLDVPLVTLEAGKLADVVKNYRTLADPEVDRMAARKELLESPLYSDLVISADGATTAMQINLRNNQDYQQAQKAKNGLLIKKGQQGLTAAEESELDEALAEYARQKRGFDAANHENIASIRKIIENYQQFGSLHLGGLTMVADDMITFIKHDLVVFGAGIFLFLVLMLSIIFRAARWVVIPLASCLFAGLIMTGMMGLVGWQVTVISSNFISLLLILTISMNVHLVVRYRQLVRDEPDWTQRELVLATIKKMFWPCLYTVLTTMIGFGSLVVSDIKPIIDFGWMMTLGLFITFVASFVIFPVLLVRLRKSGIETSESERTPFTAALANTAERHGVLVLSVSALLAVASVAGIMKLRVENSFINYFDESTEIHAGLKLIDEKLGGTTPLDVVMKFDPVEEYGDVGEDASDDLDALFGGLEADPTDAWFTAFKIDRIKAVHDYLDGLPEVGKVLSLASVIRLAEDLNEGQEFDAFELAIINKRIPEQLKASIIDPYISISESQARISTRIMDTRPDLRRNELLGRIATDLEQNFGLDTGDYEITGLMVLYNNMLQSLFKSQIMTLGVVMAGIALMLLVLFRSLSLAIIGIIPNILAAAIILGLMGWAGIPLDMMTITIASITIGIAVDNSIHYIYRFREEFPRQNRDYLATLHYCHGNIGKSVFYTAIIIIVGFSILIFSSFIPTVYFGLLTALAMFIALLAALTLLPGLILLWKPLP